MRTALIVAAVLLVPTRALAAQFVVAEVTYEHSATTTTDSHLRLPPSSVTPGNWKAPTDYATAGSVYVRLEVFTKPSTENTRFQICFEATPSYACTDQSPIYTKPGVYTWATQFPKFYQYSMVDWTKGINKTALILKDDKNVKPSPENVGDARSKLFMPSKVRVTVTVVSPGSTYVPPSTGMDAGVDATPDAMTVVDAVVEDTASEQPDTRVPEADTAPVVDSGTPETATESTDDEGGCSMATRRTTTSALPLLALAAVFLRRRRAR